MIDARIEAELAHDVVALRLAARDADRAAAPAFASWPTTLPTAPDAADTSTVSPAFGCPISFRPNQAVSPGMPRTPR